MLVLDPPQLLVDGLLLLDVVALAQTAIHSADGQVVLGVRIEHSEYLGEVALPDQLGLADVELSLEEAGLDYHGRPV